MRYVWVLGALLALPGCEEGRTCDFCEIVVTGVTPGGLLMGDLTVDMNGTSPLGDFTLQTEGCGGAMEPFPLQAPTDPMVIPLMELPNPLVSARIEQEVGSDQDVGVIGGGECPPTGGGTLPTAP